MIYPKPRKVDPKRMKRYIARTTPDEVKFFLTRDAMADLYDRNYLKWHSDTVAMKVVFSLFMEDWVEKMHIKHAGDPYMTTHVYSEYDIGLDRYVFVGRYV